MRGAPSAGAPHEAQHRQARAGDHLGAGQQPHAGEQGAQVASIEDQQAISADAEGLAALEGRQGDRLHAAPGGPGGDGMAELVKVRPEDPILWMSEYLRDNNPNTNADAAARAAKRRRLDEEARAAEAAKPAA